MTLAGQLVAKGNESPRGELVESLIPSDATLIFDKSTGAGEYQARLYRLGDDSVLGWWEVDEPSADGLVDNPDDFPEDILRYIEVGFAWPLA